ncbi:MAG: tetratricopeptide repeat protein [Phycisphaerales bacterium]|nr:tetratricopeptide repeat protein [Phycisphaerales bacterium]
MNTATANLAHAVELHQSGVWAEAEAAYRQLLADTPDHATVNRLLGALLSQTDRREEAIVHLDRAVASDPADVAARYNLGIVQRELGRLDDAVASFRRVVAAEPGRAPAHFNLGATLLETGDAAGACDAFAAAVQHDPGHVRAHRALARCAFAQEQFAAAATHWEVALGLEPNTLDDVMCAGVARQRSSDAPGAIRHFRHATSLDPRSAAAWSNLGAALHTAGALEEATAALERAVALDATLLPAHVSLALVSFDRGDATAALTACRAATTLEPEHPLPHAIAARVLIPAGELAAAATHLETARRHDPDNAEIARLEGELHLAKDDTTAAAAAFEHATTLRPDLVPAHVGRLTALVRGGQESRADALAEQLHARFPGNAAITAALATRRLAADRPAEAATLLRDTLAQPGRTHGEQRLLQFRLAAAEEQAGRFAEAWAAAVAANALAQHGFDREAHAGRVDAIIDAFAATPPPPDETRPAATAGPRPLFIVGMARSGTTLLEQMLSAHPAIGGGGELALLERCDHRIGGWIGRDVEYPDWVRDLAPSTTDAMRAFIRESLAGVDPNAEFVTEKTVTNHRYVGLMQQLFPDAIIVVCERDLLDTCVSCYFQDFTGDQPHTYDLADLGFVARQHERLMSHWRRRSTRGLITISYESLVRDPEATLRPVLEACGLPWDERCLAFTDNPRRPRTASGAQVRQPLTTASIGRHERYSEHLGPLREMLTPGTATA